MTRSLAGLDLQALRAVLEWRFQPGTLRGEPVSTVISVELTFTLKG